MRRAVQDRDLSGGARRLVADDADHGRVECVGAPIREALADVEPAGGARSVVARLQPDRETAGAETVGAEDGLDRVFHRLGEQRASAFECEVGRNDQIRTIVACVDDVSTCSGDDGPTAPACRACGNPDTVAGNGDVLRRRNRGDLACDVRRRVDALDRVVEAVPDPHRPVAERDRACTETQRDRPQRRRRAGIDAPDDALERRRHPDGAGSFGDPAEREERRDRDRPNDAAG